MTVEAEQTTGETGRGDVSGTVINVLLSMVHAHNGDVGTAQALALAGEGRSFSTLRDTGRWSSLDEAVALFNAAALVTGDGAVGLHVGERLLAWPDEAVFADDLAATGSPEEAFSRVASLADHFETESEAAALELAPDHALVRVSPLTTAGRHAHLCEMTRGLFSQVPALFGRAPALVSETECRARGGRFCLYALSWDDPGADTAADTGADTAADTGADTAAVTESPSSLPYRPAAGGPGGEGAGRAAEATAGGPEGASGDRDRSTGRRVAELEDELDRLADELDRRGVIIDGALRTAAKLLDDDVDALLAEIARGADDVVGSHRYLLMVRVRPEAPLQLHHRGLASDEAQILAAELWRDDAGEDGDHRIVVDIASPRRLYGRLVELLAPEQASPSPDTGALQLYAEYAAAALDIFGVVTDARQSDETARALLSFSEGLSGATGPDEVVQLLADAAPSVTGCDEATVYLWESEAGRLVLRARTQGQGRPDARAVTIVPVRPPAPGSGPARPDDGQRHDGSEAGPVLPGSVAAAPSDLSHAFEGSPEVVTIRTDSPVVESVVRRGEVAVLDTTVDDRELRRLMAASHTVTSVVAPLFSNRDFLGVVAANFRDSSAAADGNDPELHERLVGLADQAATALQNRELLEQVSHMAWHDALTGLPNRRLFEDRVEQELVRSRRVGEPVCMFFVDVDHFKAVNDTFGHAAGDDLIRQVGQRLVDTVRRQDTVARVGGDEFAILLPGLSDQASIDLLADRSLEALSRLYLLFDQEVPSSASIGIAMAPDHGDSYDELLSHADEAMYRAKGLGRNAFQMYSGPLVDAGNGTAADERALRADLSTALERGEFFVLYQPYIDLRTDRVVGVEALVRWSHPRLGVLEPSAFIALAERSELIVAIDAWVIGQTCRQARIWLDRGLEPLRLSVNLASRDLADPVLFDTIDDALAQSGLDPSALELEITERVVLDRTGPARENIERLRRLGVGFSIDDFGTGRSSLSRIGSFPVSTIKIDQSFIQVLGPDTEKNSLVSAIVSMADRLGLACVAEGVETSLQSRVLLQRGCTTAQGYFFSPPLPPADIERMMVAVASSGGRLDLDGEFGGLDDGDRGGAAR